MDTLEDLVRQTVNTSLERIQLMRIRERAKGLKIRLTLVVFGLALCVAISEVGKNYSQGARVCFALTAFGFLFLAAHFYLALRDLVPEAKKQRARIDTGEERLEKLGKTVQAARSDLPQTSNQALEHPPVRERRIDRFSYEQRIDELNQQFPDEQRFQCSDDAPVALRKQVAFINALYVLRGHLRDNAEGFSLTRQQRMESAKEVIDEAVSRFDDSVVLQLPA